MIRLDINPPIATLIIDRPDRRNALTHAMGDQLVDHVAILNAHPEVRVVVLRAEGPAFSAGGDLPWLNENRERSYDENRDQMEAFYRKFLSIRSLEVPTVAQLQGAATGAGLCLAMACDLRLASEEATFAANFVTLGLAPGMAGSYLLVRSLGATAAADLLLTGRTLGAEEALRLGLLNRVVPVGRLAEEVESLARTLSRNGPQALRFAKRDLHAAFDGGLDVVLSLEADAQARCFATKDYAEGLRAISERRAPSFEGR